MYQCQNNDSHEKEDPYQSVEEEISKMGREVKDFVEATLDVYLKGDVDLAYEVASRDEVINHY